jgi:hypothetical protein
MPAAISASTTTSDASKLTAFDALIQETPFEFVMLMPA